MEEIKISNVLGIKTDVKNKNILSINYRELSTDKKTNKNKGNYIERLLKIDFPTRKESKSFFDAFKNLTNIYKNKIKNK